MDSFNVIGQYLLTAFNFMAVLTILVAVHELGHYWVAKACGMEVDAFAVMMGGIRKTDLSQRLKRKLLSSKILWALAAVCAIFTVVGGLEGIPALHLVGLFGLAVAIPVWVTTRIGALYDFPLGQSFKYLGFAWTAGIAFLYFSTRFQNVALGQVLTLLGFGSAIGLLVLYYQPVLRKPEDSKMGEGELEIEGQTIPVQFRPVLSHKAKNGTEFSLLALPLGGFAAIKGMHPKADGSETTIDGGFYSKSPFARFLTLLAGPAFSIAFALVLYITLFSTVGIDRPDLSPTIGAVAPDGPLAKGGLKQGDRVVSIDGKPISAFFDMVKTVRDQAGKPLQFVYERDGKTLTATVVPKSSEVPSPVIGPDMEPTDEMRIQGKVGAGPNTKLVKLTFGEATREAFAMPVRMAGGLLSLVTQPSKAKDEVGGVGSIAKATYEATNEGLRVVLLLAAGLSMSLGFMNLLPVPPLDGGQMVVAFVEMLRRGRRLSIQVQNRVSTVGMMLVMALIVGVLMVDAGRFLGKAPEKSESPAVEQKK